MLATPKLTQIQELIAGSSREELVWLSGYLAGVVAAQGQSAPIQAVQTAVATAVETTTPAAAAAPTINKITIAYGTETGNSKKLAGDFAAKARKKGINAKLVGLEQYRLGDLTKEEYFFAVISTQGDGEPPAAAKKFYDHIHQGSLKLERLKYGVLALGDPGAGATPVDLVLGFEQLGRFAVPGPYVESVAKSARRTFSGPTVIT